MWKYIGKMFVDIVFVTVLYLVSYTNHDSNAILQVNHLSNFFLNTRSSTYSFTEIISISQYWNWLQISFIPNIRVQPWYNGEQPANMTDFINDKSSRLIGWATMRQLRLRLILSIDASCRIASAMRPLINSCKGSYSIFSDERRSFAPGWLSSSNVTYSSSIENSFIYRSSAELDSYIYLGNYGTYGGGGYVYEFLGDLNDLQDNLTLLRQLSWIDDESRAIMIQLNLYNPNVKFFTSVTLLIEISNIGEVFPSAHIDPIQMYTEFNDFSSIFYLTIAIIYIAFIICFTCTEIYTIFKLKKKYFYEFRPYIEWSIIGCSWGGVGVYIWRYNEAQRIGNYFHQTKGFQYINLQLATYVNDVLTFILAFCCFFGTIRLLRLTDIHPRINVFALTFKRAFEDIVSFTFMFFVLFSGFVILFYLLFVSKMWSCSTLLQTSGMLFEMLLLSFNFADLHNADSFLGPFVFILYIYFCVFISFTMFIVIITSHFRYVRKEMYKTLDNHPGILILAIRDIAKRIGLHKPTTENLQENKVAVIHTRYKSPVEQLSAKMDQLLIVLQRIYITYPESENKEIPSTTTSNPQQKLRKKRHVIY